MPAKTPEDLDRLFGERVNAGDVDGVVALYEPGATFITDSGPATGHASIRRFIETFVGMKPLIRMSVIKVVRGGDDLAAVYNDWQLSLTAEGERREVSGKATEIVRRQADGTWRYVIDDPNMRT